MYRKSPSLVSWMLVLIAMTLCISVVAMSGCGGPSAASKNAQQAQQAQEAADSKAKDMAELMPEIFAKLEAAGWSNDVCSQTEVQNNYNLWTNDAVFEESSAWANELFEDCYKKLVDADAIELPGENGPNEYFVFENGGAVKFKDEEVGARLTADLQTPLDDVIYTEIPAGIYLNAIASSEAMQYPLFFPLFHVQAALTYQSPKCDIEEKAYSDKFANSLNECRYVIAYAGLTSETDEGFYDKTGGQDRVVKTTLVVVMDAQSREFIHMRSVYTDTPANKTYNRVGEVNEGRALDYMRTLLAVA